MLVEERLSGRDGAFATFEMGADSVVDDCGRLDGGRRGPEPALII